MQECIRIQDHFFVPNDRCFYYISISQWTSLNKIKILYLENNEEKNIIVNAIYLKVILINLFKLL